MIAIVMVMVMMMPENNEDDCQNDENNLEDWRTSNVRWPSFSCSTQWWKLLDLKEKFTKKNTLSIWILPKLPPSLGNVVSVSPWHGGKDLSRDGSLEAVNDPSHMITDNGAAAQKNNECSQPSALIQIVREVFWTLFSYLGLSGSSFATANNSASTTKTIPQLKSQTLQ